MCIYKYIHIWRAARNVKNPPANNYAPQCFKNKGKNRSVCTHLGMDHYRNKAAWMLGSVFSPWVLDLNAKFTAQKRTCVRLVDTSHRDHPFAGALLPFV